jgi:hypothetical protein
MLRLCVADQPRTVMSTTSATSAATSARDLMSMPMSMCGPGVSIRAQAEAGGCSTI